MGGKLSALAAAPTPYGDRILPIQRIGAETVANCGGAIAIIFGETVAKRRNAACQVAHESGRLMALRRCKLLATPPTCNPFTRELRQKRPYLGFPHAVYGLGLSPILAARF
ncbi:MAG: hypothetical protein ACLPSW_31145, partial [Roseiarcus sp.]